jgi:hypothetical protein
MFVLSLLVSSGTPFSRKIALPVLIDQEVAKWRIMGGVKWSSIPQMTQLKITSLGHDIDLFHAVELAQQHLTLLLPYSKLVVYKCFVSTTISDQGCNMP